MNKHTYGFTIVELLVTMVIITLLATITGVMIIGWRENALSDAMQHDLRQAAASLRESKNFADGFPAALPAEFEPSENVALDYQLRPDGSYCLNATSPSNSDVQWYIDSASGVDPREGSCS